MLRSAKILLSELKYKLHNIALDLAYEKQVAGLSAQNIMHAEKISELNSVRLGERIRGLQLLLKKTPYWGSGHSELAALAFNSGDSEKAYCSSQAVLKLKTSAKNIGKANHILAKCYLKSRNFSAAQPLLQNLNEKYPAQIDIAEDLSAVFMAQGKHADALRMLTTISTEKQTPQIKAVLEYLNSKREDRSA